MYKLFHRYAEEQKCYYSGLYNLFCTKMLRHVCCYVVFSFLRMTVELYGLLEETIQREVKCTVK